MERFARNRDMQASQLHRLDVDGVEVAVETAGHGSIPVLFVHGLGANRGCWYRANEFFDLGRYRLILPDLPGFGSSARPTNYSYSMADFGRCLHRVVERFAEAPAHVIAHSMGCAAVLAMLADDRVAIASLVAAEGNLVPEDAFMSGRIARRSESAFLRLYPDWVAVMADSGSSDSNGLSQRYIESLRDASPVALYRAARSCSECSVSGDLIRQFVDLRCPLAYSHGGNTPNLRPLPRAVLASHIERFVVEGQGHFMMQDAENFYRPIVRWIESLQVADLR